MSEFKVQPILEKNIIQMIKRRTSLSNTSNFQEIKESLPGSSEECLQVTNIADNAKITFTTRQISILLTTRYQQ